MSHTALVDREKAKPHSRRRFHHRVLALVASVGLAFGLVSCSQEEGNTAKGGGDFEPVSITHALGTVEITSKPERVVTIGQGSAEIAIALGVTPVAMEEYSWGADESGYLPWVKEAVEEKGEELPALIKSQDELSAEEVLKYEPDLILGPWSGMTEEQYDKLSKIAPTVAYPKEKWTITWEEQIQTVAKALGQPEEADKLINQINEEFSKAEKPEYQNTTFSYIYNNAGPDSYGVFMPTEQRVAFVSKLGLRLDPVVESLRGQVASGTDSAPLSPEKLDLLKDSDLIFTFYRDDAVRKTLHEDPIYSQILAIARGSEVALTDQSMVTASSMVNPLSVPWVLKRYTEKIDEAIAKARS
ncbi:ABC transporter substrate-binding protein [Corynebacterium poyangense]|uniref:ABC transporter substrate-binding protein n=1 Tax=Corynebacterium poyangense TaxID=2684405 RepID=A0A7H0SM66_9CORY|nr:iron-siderophore ABC transporter substrate-binding protein [Corynebacterium poyangense]QNQ89641.1 ABC transporter substrate-binding protein [Corynebacterium poyangense]